MVWPLLFGLVGLFAAALLTLGGALLMASREADTIADGRVAAQLAAALAQEERRLERQSLDWAWWDEGIEKFVLAPDEDYARTNFGDYVGEVFGIAFTLVITPEDRLSFAFLDGEALAVAEAEGWHDAVAPLVAATRAASLPDRPAPVSGYLTRGEDLLLVSATAMAAESGEAIAGWPQPAVLLFGRRLDAGFFEELAPILGLGRLAVADPSLTGANVVEIEGFGRLRLSWQLSYPGRQMLTALTPIALAVALALLALVALLSTRILALTSAFRRERERREAELIEAERRATAADRAKSLFLANTSHELRTPLNAVIGYAEALRLELFGPLNERQREYLCHVEQGGQHLLAVLQDILDLARIEARREQLEEAEVDPRAVVARAFTLLEPLRRQREIRLELHDRSGGRRLRADERRLLQMLLNLLSNAMSFSPVGSTVRVLVCCDAGPEAEPADGLVLEVQDEGPGLPAEELEKVLRPFHQLPTGPAESRRESNGLGLPLTAMLMTLHGGRLTLENLPLRGLSASLRFPPERALAAEAPESPGA